MGFVGRVIDRNGVSIKSVHIKIASEWRYPLTKKIWNLFRLLNYHREHIPQFAHLSEPLYKFASKLKSGKRTLPVKLLKLFDAIKKLIVEAPFWITQMKTIHLF